LFEIDFFKWYGAIEIVYTAISVYGAHTRTYFYRPKTFLEITFSSAMNFQSIGI